MRGQNDSTIYSGILRSVNFVNMVTDGNCLVMSLDGICFTVMKEKEDQLPFGKNCKHTKKKTGFSFYSLAVAIKNGLQLLLRTQSFERRQSTRHSWVSKNNSVH